MYSLEALEVRDASEAFRDGSPGGQGSASSAATELKRSLSEFMPVVKSEHKATGEDGVAFSLAPRSLAEVADTVLAA
jgi:hypothetical protein